MSALREPNADCLEWAERGDLPSDLVAELAGSILGGGARDRSFSRPLFVAGNEIDAFYADFRIVLGLVERLPSLLGLGLRAFASLVGTPSAVVDLLDDVPTPPVPRYGRADLFHDGERFRILELGISPAVGGVTRAAAVPRLLLADPGFASLVEPLNVRRLDPMHGVVDLLRNAQAPEDVVLVEASGALADWAPGWMLLADGLRAEGWSPRLAEIGALDTDGRSVSVDGGPVGSLWRLFTLSELAGEPDPAASWARLRRAQGSVPLVTPPECDVFNSKACLALLRHPEVIAALTEDERAAIERTVPDTWFPIDEARLLGDQPQTILKPATGARGEGTVAGWATSPEEWQAAVARARADGGYVAQRRVNARIETATDRVSGRPASWRAVWGMHYGPSGLTGLSARVTAESGPAVVTVATSEVLLAPVLVHDDAPRGAETRW